LTKSSVEINDTGHRETESVRYAHQARSMNADRFDGRHEAVAAMAGYAGHPVEIEALGDLGAPRCLHGCILAGFCAVTVAQSNLAE